MIETWLQVSCDGCDDPGMVDNTGMPNTTKAVWRKELHSHGWRSYGSKDYCPRCVKGGVHKLRTSVYSN
ncbi:hypothetical protein M3795_25040 [Ralstonia pickettii]|uniref:hypothetical protein n=1 Tax=Ralstonia pickettii TaxID=329 RepID=UPI00203C6F88|nr:hypothetical protein [Ralstonia pickettii]MCM3583739.1 hypothetical protein [Ralstonia pickettii]